jgi:hypothetical protein
MCYFRVAPDADTWICKRGARVLERFETVIEAVDRAEAEAALHRPSEVWYHDREGRATVIATYPDDAG